MNPAALILLDHAPVEVKTMWFQRLLWADRRHKFQRPPPGHWRGWMMKAGRGAGKTRTGAQDAVEYCLDHPGHRYAIVAPTQADVRAVCFEGESGVIGILNRMGVEYSWNVSHLTLLLPNGSQMVGYSAEKPDRLRGPQFHRAWCDELAAWKDAARGDALNTTFNNLHSALRLGEDARMLVTTTPRRVALVRDLLTRDNWVTTSGTTYDNIVNLSPTFADAILRYEGSHIGRQELHGELIEDVEGALWTVDLIERARLAPAGSMQRVVVGVDPPGGATEAGIVVAALTHNCVCGRPGIHAYVLADYSLRGTPDQWAQQVVAAYDDYEADRVVGEVNYGGDMVEKVVRSVRANIPFTAVRATRGKAVRAEPVVALYEQQRIHHVGYHAELEDEMTTWEPEAAWSPNRLDALVWAITELGLTTNREARVTSPALQRV